MHCTLDDYKYGGWIEGAAEHSHESKSDSHHKSSASRVIPLYVAEITTIRPDGYCDPMHYDMQSSTTGSWSCTIISYLTIAEERSRRNNCLLLVVRVRGSGYSRNRDNIHC